MDKDEVIAILAMVIIALTIFGGALGFSAMECNTKATAMQVNHEFFVIGGCMIEVEHGKFIPLSSYYFKEE